MLHLSPDQVRAFLRHELPPDETITVGDHLAECVECRAVATALSTTPRMERQLEEALAADAHLTFEELEELAGNATTPEHVLHCSACFAELDDLRKFRASLKPQVIQMPSRKNRAWIVGALAVAVAAALVLVVSRLPQYRKTPPAAAMASLRDGFVEGPGPTPEELRDVSPVLQSGELPHAKLLDSLVKHREVLLSDGQPAAGKLIPAWPVGTAVLSDRPKFTWNAVDGARWYRVAVYGANFESVGASGPIRKAEWTPDKPLPRAETLTWTVTASLPGGEVTAPRSPEPEAKFQVVSAEDSARMQTVFNRLPHSDLLVMIRASELGLKEEARAAAQAVVSANPGSPIAARLLDAARSPR